MQYGQGGNAVMPPPNKTKTRKKCSAQKHARKATQEAQNQGSGLKVTID
jgi:hypothetical protein